MTKQQWRTILKIKRDSLSEQEIVVRSQQFAERLWAFITNNKVKTLHTYLPIGSELSTKFIIQKALAEKLTVVVPKTLANRQLKHLKLHSLEELTVGKFGTKFPQNEVEFTGNYDLIIVPGLGFDSLNYRLGYGSGYYDIFLSQHPGVLKIGIGYDFQLVDKLPIEAHDVALDEVFLI